MDPWPSLYAYLASLDYLRRGPLGTVIEMLSIVSFFKFNKFPLTPK